MRDATVGAAAFPERGGRPVILDGALATELEARGFTLDDPLWSARVLLEAPEAVRAVHRDYLLAGADVITTAGYQATFEGLARRGLDRARSEGVLLRAVELAREARDAFASGPERPWVAASLGPYGALLADGSEFRGGYGLHVEALRDFHRPRVDLLARSGAELLAFETVPCIEEAEAIARALEDLDGPGAWVSFSCRDGAHVAQGERIEDCVAAVEGVRAVVAVGVNCSHPRWVEELLERARSATRKPLLAYPNRGGRWLPEERRWDDSEAPHALAWYAARYVAAGARAVGGCCRTTPGDIRSLRQTLGGPSPG
ncbi:MAG: homocysteine S-methyltransferase [Deltaproteobacteria bacterium]|nr:homocysteine S-methyltransferase [Deltaproteobacteria bacterium]